MVLDMKQQQQRQRSMGHSHNNIPEPPARLFLKMEQQLLEDYKNRRSLPLFYLPKLPLGSPSSMSPRVSPRTRLRKKLPSFVTSTSPKPSSARKRSMPKDSHVSIIEEALKKIECNDYGVVDENDCEEDDDECEYQTVGIKPQGGACNTLYNRQSSEKSQRRNELLMDNLDAFKQLQADRQQQQGRGNELDISLSSGDEESDDDSDCEEDDDDYL